ncbi:MAG: hypothetical protein WD096_07370 [Actinomycetota bacterium]
MRFQIDFEGVVPVSDSVLLDAAMDAAMEALLLREVADPSVSGALSGGRVEVSFVIEAQTTEQALANAHAFLREATTHDGWSGAIWEIARAEAIRAANRASV